jgi:hypothetical protein
MVRRRWRLERDRQVCCSREPCTACLITVLESLAPACLTLLYRASHLTTCPSPPAVGWRDRRRRLAEAIFALATNAMIGNQKAVPKLKMVLRLLSKFMHEPGPLARVRRRLHQGCIRASNKRHSCNNRPPPPPPACSLCPTAPCRPARVAKRPPTCERALSRYGTAPRPSARARSLTSCSRLTMRHSGR